MQEKKARNDMTEETQKYLFAEMYIFVPLKRTYYEKQIIFLFHEKLKFFTI